MNSQEKEIQYTITNTYSTLNELTPKTKNVWFVCHGMDFLSRYFIKPFEILNPEENYIIAPQASSKHYLNNKFTHVGASWLTRERTQPEMENVLNNFDAIIDTENISEDMNLIVLGFSQGVSVASRWVARRKIPCAKLVLYAGKVPREFTNKDFNAVEAVEIYFGDKDEYINDEILLNEKIYLESLFKDKMKVSIFEGNHVVKPEVIARILS